MIDIDKPIETFRKTHEWRRFEVPAEHLLDSAYFPVFVAP
jgi:hypothetical protein